jgi:hypothetical protein
MKLNLFVEGVALNGYVNITPLPAKGSVLGDLRNLDPHCGQAEATEIRATGVLDYVHHSEIIETLRNWVSKLRHGGKLVVGGLEIEEIARLAYIGEYTPHETNQLIFGSGNNYAQLKRGCHSIEDICELLAACGLHIKSKRLLYPNFVIEAVRP